MGCGCGKSTSQATPPKQVRSTFVTPPARISREEVKHSSTTCKKCKVGMLQVVKPMQGPRYLKCPKCNSLFYPTSG